jgi:ketosteroid isomerase-like protein
MKKIMTLLCAAVSLILMAHAASASPEEEVLQTERDLAKVYQRSDAVGIERGVTQDYRLTNSHGKISTRADDISDAKKVDPKYEIFENQDMQVRVHGPTAVVTGITHAKGTSGGEPFDARFQFTDTFIKDNGRWRLFAGHATKMSPEVK